MTITSLTSAATALWLSSALFALAETPVRVVNPAPAAYATINANDAQNVLDTATEGLVLIATGQGVNLYRRDKDGVWRVARDIWSRAPVAERFGEMATCAGDTAPC